MCGITGKVYLNSKSIESDDLKVMNKAVSHRGPDDSGIYISPDRKVGLGNQRLSIIDLSPNGHMPMGYMDKYVITFNGEIYNFNESKVKLQKMGYKFRSNSDTEVILALYDKYGLNCLRYLRGMFAFAIFDKNRATIFLARDRIGKKPLKYFFNNNVLIFASELKAILTQKEVKKDVDKSAIYNYLTYGYTIPPKTGFLNINKLEPGHYLILHIKSGTLSKKCYWQPDFSKKLNLTENDWQKEILQKLTESVRLRMISDVPIGAFLSGGIDSSTVVALMAQNSKEPIKTFTISFKDKSLDESIYAENIVRKYKTDHQKLIAVPENVELLPELARIYEEPFADASSVVTSMISRLAKKSVTVVLNGDGGDENFVGYERYRRVQRDYIFDKYLSFTKKPLQFSAKMFAMLFPKNYLTTRSLNFFNKSNLPISERYGSYIQYFSKSEMQKLSIDETKVRYQFNEIENIYANLNKVDPRDIALFWDMTRYLPNDLLAKVDIASMAVGLEARSPFLDQELIELACKIPFDLKYKGGKYKYILKKAIKDLVPSENIERRKIGFTIPLDKWFEGSLNKYARSILLKKNNFSGSIINQDYIEKMLDEHNENSDFGPRLWSLLSLELWHRSYF